MQRLLLILFLVLATPAVAADVKMRDRLNAIVEARTPEHVFMGSVLVAQGDDILLSRGYGLAKPAGASVPNRPDTQFRIGSLTKQFTAALVMKLSDQGRIQIDRDISSYLKDVPTAWRGVTVANLLTHTSGVPDYVGLPDAETWGRSAHTPAEIVGRVRSLPLQFQPGAKFAYSSTNYILLGQIVEAVTGKDFGQALTREILRPAGLSDTGLDRDGLAIPRRAEGQTPLGGGLLQAVQSQSMTIPWTAGAMYSTTQDLLRWQRALFTERVVSKESLARMLTPGPVPYGMGLGLGQLGGTQIVSHGGAVDGFHSYMIYAPEKQITVVVLSNTDGPLPDLMARELLQAALGQDVATKRVPSAKPLPPGLLAQVAGDYQVGPAKLRVVIDQGRLTVFEGPNVLPGYFIGNVGSAPTFYLPKADGELSFQIEGAGAALKVEWRPPGGVFEGKRL